MLVATMDPTVQVALVSTAGLVLVCLIPLLFQIKKSIQQNVGKANGEGNLVEMNIRALEQLGIVRYDVGTIKTEQDRVKQQLSEVKYTDLAEAKRARAAIREELTHVHDAVRQHFDDHLHGRQWTIEIKPGPVSGELVDKEFVERLPDGDEQDSVEV